MKTVNQLATSAFALLSVLTLCQVATFAAPQADKKPDAKKPDAKKPATKLIDVWTCPIQGEKIADHKTEAGKPEVVGNYRVHFCCGGCDTSFAKLSAKDKKAKAEAAYKKDIAKTSSGDKKGKG